MAGRSAAPLFGRRRLLPRVTAPAALAAGAAVLCGVGAVVEAPAGLAAWRALLGRLAAPEAVAAGLLLLAVALGVRLGRRSGRRQLEWTETAFAAMGSDPSAFEAVIERAPAELRGSLDHLAVTMALQREHAERTRALAELAQEALVGVTRAGEISLWTPNAERLFERSSGEALGRPVTELVPNWRREELQTLLATALDGAPLELQTQIRTQRGHVRDALVSSAPVPEERPSAIALGLSWRALGAGGVGAHAGYLANRALEASRDGLLVVDVSEDHAIRYASVGLGHLTGFDADQLVGCKLSLLVSQESRASGRSPLEDVLAGEVAAGESPPVFSVPFQRRDGSGFWGEVAASPVRDAEGTVLQAALCVRDVGTRREALDRAEREETRLRAVVAAAPLGVAELDAKGCVIWANPALREILAHEADELTGVRLTELLPDDALAFPGGAELEWTGPGGRRAAVLMRRPAPGSGSGEIVFLLDVSQRKRAERGLREALERSEGTLASLAEAIVAVRTDRCIESMNPAAQTLLALPVEEARGLTLDCALDLLDEESKRPLPDPVERCLRLGEAVDVGDRALLRRRDGSERAVHVSVSPLRASDERLLGAVLSLRDVSDLRMLARRFAHEASHDPLTGLVNRREYEFRVEQLLEAPPDARRHAILFVDLDRFKEVNDQCGHAAGDELLKQIAGVMRGVLRPGDLLARLGGDEFGALLTECEPRAARELAERLCVAVSEHRFAWDGNTFRLGASAGVAPLRSGAGVLADVLGAADAACADAKLEGRGRVSVAGASKAGARGERWEEVLRRAIEQDHLRLLSQPMRGTARADGALAFRELLVGLNDPAGRLLPAESFLPAARRCGMLAKIDRWVVATAFAAAARRKEPAEVLCINLSTATLSDPAFVRFAVEQLERHGLEARAFCFELHEPDVMAHYATVAATVRELGDRGFRLSLDDGGSGLVDFTHLRSLPFEMVKVHESLVRRARDDEVYAVVFESLCRIAHAVGLRVVAEGVEDDATAERAEDLGADYIQGFVVARPALLDLD